MARQKQTEPTAEPTAEPTDTPKGRVSGYAEYKLAGAIPDGLVGKLIRTPEAANLDEMHLLVEDGKPENVCRLAQAQFDIIIQRALRNAATSDETAEILAGKVVDIDGEKLDFADMAEAERIAYVTARIQSVSDDFVYGARGPVSGGQVKQAKEALKREQGLKAAAQADPDLAAKLAALGYTL